MFVDLCETRVVATIQSLQSDGDPLSFLYLLDFVDLSMFDTSGHVRPVRFSTYCIITSILYYYYHAITTLLITLNMAIFVFLHHLLVPFDFCILSPLVALA